MITRRHFLAALPGAWLTAKSFPRLLAAGREEATPASPAKLLRVGVSDKVVDPSAQKPAELMPASSKYCKILQFTDLHLFQNTDDFNELTLRDCRQQVEWHKPDLVVITGDSWHNNVDGSGIRALEYLVEAVSGWKTAWAFCWGNHDQLDDYPRGHDLLAGAPHCLYRGGQAHGHYRVEIRAAAAGPASAPLMDLFFLNSGMAGLGSVSLDWLRTTTASLKSARSQPLPALAFFHIPITEYETRIAGGNFRGTKLESVGPLEKGAEVYGALTAAKTIRACYCGHCHVNDYAVKTGDLELVFGRASGRAGYGGEFLRKGAKLIEIELATGKPQQRTVFADGAEWLAWQRGTSAGLRLNG